MYILKLNRSVIVRFVAEIKFNDSVFSVICKDYWHEWLTIEMLQKSYVAITKNLKFK